MKRGTKQIAHFLTISSMVLPWISEAALAQSNNQTIVPLNLDEQTNWEQCEASLYDVDNQKLFGAWISSGGELRRDQENVWFLQASDESKPQYCIQVANGYPFSKSELQTLVKESISDWKAFFAKYGLAEKPFMFDFSDGKKRTMAFDFEEISVCDNRPHQLEFLFGLKNNLVRHYLQNNYALGAAVRGPYDHTSYRSGGTVWIPDFTNAKHHLKHLVLHELGHVFGMTHNSVMVMDMQTIQWLEAYASKDGLGDYFYSSVFGQIENANWTYDLIKNKPQSLYEGSIYFDNKPTADGFRPNSLLPKKLIEAFGLKPGGYHTLSINLTEQGTAYTETEKIKLELTITDDQQNSYVLTGKFRTKIGRDYVKVFTEVPDSSGDSHYRDNLLHYYYDLHLPAEGYFVLNNQKIPTQISVNQGFNIKMFLPDSKEWSSWESFGRDIWSVQ